MVIVSLDSPSCEVPCLILHSVVYRDVTRQAKGLHHLKYVGTLESGLAYLSWCNSGWFCHSSVATPTLISRPRKGHLFTLEDRVSTIGKVNTSAPTNRTTSSMLNVLVS
jgi:hypothetical protein